MVACISAEWLCLPLDAFLRVLGLLQHKHEVVEELLEPLVGEVNADLLEPVVLEVLEASNIQDINQVDSLQLLDIKSFVGNVDQPGEGSL